MSYGSYGLVGTGRKKLDDAQAGLASAAAMEERRASANDQLKTAAKNQQKQLIGTGAGLGLAAGMSMGATYGSWAGPIGMGIGALAGALAYELF